MYICMHARMYVCVYVCMYVCMNVLKKLNWKGITFVLNCTNFQKYSPKETQDICGHFYACDTREILLNLISISFL